MMQFTTIIRHYDSCASYKVMAGAHDYTVTLDKYTGDAASFPHLIMLQKDDLSNHVHQYSSIIEQRIAEAIRCAEGDDYGIS